MAAQVLEMSRPSGGKGLYAYSAMNATRHGILSRHAVLPWEDKTEHDSLLDALMQEYAPATPTEAHLVEELARCMWGKKRLRLAESAAYHDAATNEIDQAWAETGTPSYVRAALIGSNTDAWPLQSGTANLASNYIADGEVKAAQQELTRCEKLRKMFESNNLNLTLAMLNEAEAKDWQGYQQHISAQRERTEQPPHSEDKLFLFWLESRADACRKTLAMREHAPRMQQHIAGRAYASPRLETIARYETHFDRKFERTLAMLLRLKDLRTAAAISQV